MRCTFTLLFLALAFLLTIVDSRYNAADDSRNKVNTVVDEKIWAIEGEDVELPCDITSITRPQDKVSMVLWFKDEAGVPLYTLDARNTGGDLFKAVHWTMSGNLGNRTYFQVDSEAGLARLKVKGVAYEDQGVFRCRVDFVNSPTNNFRVNLTFIEPPRKPVIYDAQGKDVKSVAGPFLEGYELVLHCQVAGVKPALVSIVLEEDEIYAGRPMNVRCETWGSWPGARLVWRLAGLVMRDSSLQTPTQPPLPSQKANLTISKLALVLDKDDDAKELTCRAENPRFPGGVLETTKVLNVLYPPTATVSLASGFDIDTLREGDDVTFVCHYKSNPRPTSIEWMHNNKRLEHNVEAGVLLASSSLTLRVLTLAHNGAYSCLVRNTVGEVRSPSLPIHMKYVPRCKSGHERQDLVAVPGDTLRLRCEIEADPRDNVRFSWTRNSSLGDVSAVPNPRPLSHTLEYVPRSDDDFGTVACWAINSIGQQKHPCRFDLIPAKPPQKPIDCSIRNESSAMEVNCIPGASGGLPQHFVLEVHGSLENSKLLQQIPQNDQGVSTDSSSSDISSPAALPVYSDRNEEPSFQVYGLQPGYDYTIVVYAENSRGRSQPVLIENIRVSESVQRSRFLGALPNVISDVSSLKNVFIVITLIIAVSLILVGIGVAIGVVICRRRARPVAQESLDDFTTPTYISAQRVEPRIRYGSGSDRRRSQRTSLYLEDNRIEPDLLQQVDIDQHE
ncbi:synaptogenesis protein syg-2-like isoform X3 [Phymastichus coffea]|uniref:synaptogenesis protein syg-2-like isoform X3 n=1 Tax=Phymastichus coffea TaxID=108790 RepID=UPI00273BD729|nr:synaptogenesis protein syg-2-like isoform X3 [Phymastichus coffea]